MKKYRAEYKLPNGLSKVDITVWAEDEYDCNRIVSDKLEEMRHNERLTLHITEDEKV